MPEISEILANVSAYGFHFAVEHVSTGEDKATDLGEVPILVVDDVTLFNTSFPGRIKAGLDGQSFRVISQRVSRSAREKNRTVSVEALKPKVLNAILGIRQRAEAVDTLAEYLKSKGITREELDAAVGE